MRRTLDLDRKMRTRGFAAAGIGARRSIPSGKKTTNRTIRKREERKQRSAEGRGSFDPVAFRQNNEEAFEKKRKEVAARKEAKAALKRARRLQGKERKKTWSKRSIDVGA